MLRRLIPLAAAVWTLASAEAAVAQEYCVTCSGPDATYRCLIGGESSSPAANSSRGQFLCITELAKAGGHASCSAARGQATPCPGETRTVMFTLGDPGASPLETGTPQPLPATPPPPAPAMAPGSTQPLAPVAVPPEAHPAQGSPDQTADTPGGAQPQHKPNAVEKLANQTGKAVSDTGKAVGHAVKKSWDCVTSFFGDC